MEKQYQGKWISSKFGRLKIDVPDAKYRGKL